MKNFPVITTEMELGYYHQRVNGLVASPTTGQFKSEDLRKSGNFKKTYEILEITNKCPALHPKQKFSQIHQNITKR